MSLGPTSEPPPMAGSGQGPLPPLAPPPLPPAPAAEGDPWTMRRPLLLGALALAGLIFGFGLWATCSRLSSAVVASGQIEVMHNRQILQHPDGGVVASVEVSEGQAVAQGQVLIRLDGAKLSTELAIVEGRLSELTAQRARLTAERDGLQMPVFAPELIAQAARNAGIREQIEGQRSLFMARVAASAKQAEQLSRQIGQIRARLNGIAAQAEAVALQLQLIRAELANQQALFERGLAQLGSVLGLQREEARLRGQAGSLIADRAQADERITEIEVQIAALEVSRREEASLLLRETAPLELELAERRRGLRAQIARLDLRAPVAGIVMGLSVTTPQAVLRPAEPVLYVVPQNRPLLIAAQVMPTDIDQVQSGQGVELVFAAFSPRVAPHLQGRVVLVSADAFLDQASQLRFYRVEILLEPGELQRLEGLVLLPGMPVETFIRTGSHTPMAWLLMPFTDYFNHALRES